MDGSRQEHYSFLALPAELGQDPVSEGKEAEAVTWDFGRCAASSICRVSV